MLALMVVMLAAPIRGTTAVAVKKPNFSGKWKLDMAASSYTIPQRNLPYDSMVLEIDHHEPELIVTRKIYQKGAESIQYLLYYCDGRGEENPALAGPTKRKSRTSWNGDLLVSNSKGSVGANVTESCQVWELSSDGQILTYYLLPDIPPFGTDVRNSQEFLGRLKSKSIYRKIS